MRILIIGGTVFVGRHIVDVARDAGHTITIFHRGLHPIERRHGVEELIGDRDSAIEALGGRSWDVVVDTCGYLPRVVRKSAELLRDSVGKYVFVSTRGVYAWWPSDGEPRALPEPRDESAPRAKVPDDVIREMETWRPRAGEYLPTFDWYGGLKALCEDVIADNYGERALIVRPGLIVGPHDPTDRFTYWVHRVARGGEVLAPGRPDRVVSFVDVRDLAAFVLRLVEGTNSGAFDAVGPTGWTMGSVLAVCKEVSESDATFTWLDESFLLAEKVTEWTELPVWVRESINAGLEPFNERALAHGLAFRPLQATVGDTLAWDSTRPTDAPRANGMSPDREVELLRAWHARSA